MLSYYSCNMTAGISWSALPYNNYYLNYLFMPFLLWSLNMAVLVNMFSISWYISQFHVIAVVYVGKIHCL